MRLETPADLPQALAELRGKSVLVDPGQSSAWYFEALNGAGAAVLRGDDPCVLPRACKNPVEIEGTKRAHARDGAALTRFLHWVRRTGRPVRRTRSRPSQNSKRSARPQAR